MTLANSPEAQSLGGDLYQEGSFSPNDRLYAGPSQGGAVDVWSVASGQIVARLHSHAAPTEVVRFSPNGRLVASSGDDGVTYLQPADGVGPVLALRRGARVTDVAFSPDGARLATATLGTSAATTVVQIWNTRSGQPVGAPETSDGQFVEFSPNGRFLISGSTSVGIVVWRVSHERLASASLTGASRALMASLATGDSELGGQLIESELGGIRVYSIFDGDQVAQLGFSRHINPFAATQDGTRIVTTDSLTGTGGTYIAHLYACDACGPVAEVEHNAEALVKLENPPTGS